MISWLSVKQKNFYYWFNSLKGVYEKRYYYLRFLMSIKDKKTTLNYFFKSKNKVLKFRNANKVIFNINKVIKLLTTLKLGN